MAKEYLLDGHYLVKFNSLNTSGKWKLFNEFNLDITRFCANCIDDTFEISVQNWRLQGDEVEVVQIGQYHGFKYEFSFANPDSLYKGGNMGFNEYVVKDINVMQKLDMLNLLVTGISEQLNSIMACIGEDGRMKVTSL